MSDNRAKASLIIHNLRVHGLKNKTDLKAMQAEIEATVAELEGLGCKVTNIPPFYENLSGVYCNLELTLPD